MTTLIFRIESRDDLAAGFSLTIPALESAGDIMLDRQGETVAFGLSQVPGLWTVLAIGKLIGSARESDCVRVFFAEVVALAEAVTVVTAGDAESDRGLRPYALDVLAQEDAARLPGIAEDGYAQPEEAHVLSVAEAGEAGLAAGIVCGGLRLERQDRRFFHKVAHAYGWRCAYTGMCQFAPDGRAREGVVIGLEAPFRVEDGPVSQGMFVSGSIAFFYRHGLLAIGDDYEILRHAELCAEMRTILEVINRKALLKLPPSATDWPDLEVARRHRLRFGY